MHPVSAGIWDGLASQIQDIQDKKQPLKIELTLMSLEKEFERLITTIRKALDDHRQSLQIFKSTLTLKGSIEQTLANLNNHRYEEVKGRHLFELVHSLSKDDLYENAGMVESLIRQKNDRVQRAVSNVSETLQTELDLETDRIRAWQLRHQKRYQESKELFMQIIKRDPKDDWSYWFMGVNERCLESYNRAIDCYDKAIEINPRDYEYYFSRAYSYFQMGKWRHVVEDCTRAIELNP